GLVWMSSVDGERVLLRVGMRVSDDAELITDRGASVHMQMAGLQEIVIGGNREFVFSVDVVDPGADAVAAVVVEVVRPQIDRLIAAIEEGRDPFDEVDPTAAILEGGGGGGGTFVRLARILESTSPLEIDAAAVDSSAGSDNSRLGSGFESTAADEF